jgi:hypothetical protein
VEQDLLLLRDSSPSRPMRDLGTLREFSDPDPAPGSDPDLEDGSGVFPDGTAPGLDEIPWENPVKHGWIKGFMTTVRNVMFRAPIFFAAGSGSDSLAPGYLFFLILGYVTIVGSLAWGQAAVSLLPEAAIPFTGRVALPALLLLAPLALGLMQLFVVGFIRISLLLFAPEKADFLLIYKIVSYSVAPFMLSIVPFVGPLVGALWFLAALVAGCRYGMKLSWRLAVLLPLPPALLLLSGLVWYFL